MVLFSCKDKTIRHEVIQRQDTVYNNQDSLIKEKVVAGNLKEELNPDYSISPIVFSTLSNERRKMFVNNHQAQLDKTLLDYYDNYSTINNIDSIFEVLVSIDFSTQTDKNLLTFYTYALCEIVKNKYVDGYVGEELVEKCYALFSKFPGCFYQHMNLTDEKTKESFIFNIASGVYYNIDKELLAEMIEQHKIMLPKYIKAISEIGKGVIKAYEKIYGDQD